IGLALAVDTLLEPELDEIRLGQLAVEEARGLRVEVVELLLEDRDDMPREFLDDLGVLRRAGAGGLGGDGLHRGVLWSTAGGAGRGRFRQTTKSGSGYSLLVGRTP